MQFFRDYDKLSSITLKDLPGKKREPYFQLPGVMTYHRPGNVRQVHIYQPNGEAVLAKLRTWFTEMNALHDITDAALSDVTGTSGQKTGIACAYAHERDALRIDSYVFCPYAMFLNFPYVKRFHLQGLTLPNGTPFSEDDTWVRLIVRNDALIFALEVVHEGHDYTLREPRHLTWAHQLLDNLSIEQASLEYDVEFFLSCEEDFDKLYAFLTAHAIGSTYH